MKREYRFPVFGIVEQYSLTRITTLAAAFPIMLHVAAETMWIGSEATFMERRRNSIRHRVYLVEIYKCSFFQPF